MKSNKGGCCGHPAMCAFSMTGGRCKAREDYEKRAYPDHVHVPDLGLVKQAFNDQVPQLRQTLENHYGDDLAAIEKVRERRRNRAAKKEREHTRSRGRERTMDM